MYINGYKQLIVYTQKLRPILKQQLYTTYALCHELIYFLQIHKLKKSL
jgi:hypothetical protein